MLVTRQLSLDLAVEDDLQLLVDVGEGGAHVGSLQSDGFQPGGDDAVSTGQENARIVLRAGVRELVDGHAGPWVVGKILLLARVTRDGLSHRKVAGALAEIGGASRAGDEGDEPERVEFSLVGELGGNRQSRPARRAAGRSARPGGQRRDTEIEPGGV